MKKYELTNETKDGLHRIRALIDIPSIGVKAGDRGGWVENESNLSHEGDAWVSGNARVSGNTQVFGNAQVSGNAWVFWNARVSGNTQVSGNAQVSGNTRVYGNAWVFGNARVSGNTQVSGNAQVSGNTRVYGNAQVSGNARASSVEHILTGQGMASSMFNYTLTPTIAAAPRLIFGCWQGTVPEFRAMIESEEWIAADAAARELRRPELLALTAVFEARIATWDKEK